MDYPNYTTEYCKGKHLTYEDYVRIQVRLQDGWSANRIAVDQLHCSANTVRNIIRQGMTPLYHGKVFRFKAKTVWQAHKEHRSRCCRPYKATEKEPFLTYVVSHFRGEDRWPLEPVLAMRYPTTCSTAERWPAPKRSITMLTLGCSVSKTSTCRKSCAVAPRQKEYEIANVYWVEALRNYLKPLIPERNSGTEKSTR